MASENETQHTYRIGNITFIVKPVYAKDGGKSIFTLLLRLMKADVEEG